MCESVPVCRGQDGADLSCQGVEGGGGQGLGAVADGTGGVVVYLDDQAVGTDGAEGDVALPVFAEDFAGAVDDVNGVVTLSGIVIDSRLVEK